jgi:hypothetical protein
MSGSEEIPVTKVVFAIEVYLKTCPDDICPSDWRKWQLVTATPVLNIHRKYKKTIQWSEVFQNHLFREHRFCLPSHLRNHRFAKK